ncbi:uncharacterized protein [Cherax quadricarinatus]
MSNIMENSTCGVCSLTYDTEQHVPLVMKCGHDYCRQCLQKLVKKESLTCPFPACRARYEKLNMSELTKVLGLIPKTKIPVPRIVSPTTDTSIQERGESRYHCHRTFPALLTSIHTCTRHTKYQTYRGTYKPIGPTLTAENWNLSHNSLVYFPGLEMENYQTTVGREDQSSSSGVSSMSDRSNKNTCGVCCQKYAPGKHDPLLLPCGHDFCRMCLEKLETAEGLLCPSPTCGNHHCTLKVINLAIIYDILRDTHSTPQTLYTRSQELQVKIIDMMGHMGSIKISLGETIGDVKKRLEARYGSNPVETSIIFKGITRHDQCTIQELGLTTGSTLQVTSIFLGGGELYFALPRAKCTL